MYWPLGSSFVRGPPGWRTIIRTGLPLTSAIRPPTWNEPMPRSTMSSSAASGVRAAEAGTVATKIRRMPFLLPRHSGAHTLSLACDCDASAGGLPARACAPNDLTWAIARDVEAADRCVGCRERTPWAAAPGRLRRRAPDRPSASRLVADIQNVHALRRTAATARCDRAAAQVLGVAADAPPLPVGCAQQLGGIGSHRVGMIGVHMREDPGSAATSSAAWRSQSGSPAA